MRQKFIIITLFWIAMAFIEASVVVYLRAAYYPAGFTFPLHLLPDKILAVEVFREAATMVVLLTFALLAGRTKTQKICYFFYAFAVWDIFYYVWLKATINWPLSLLDPDILFLIPAPWIGPVLAPVLVSMVWIILAIATIIKSEKGVEIEFGLREWLLFILGAAVIFTSFVIDASVVLSENAMPHYRWEMLFAGIFVWIVGYVIAYKKRSGQ